MLHYPNILSIKISKEKKKKRVVISEGYLLKGFGLKDDAYSKPGDREVCLMSKNTVNKLDSNGLCIKRFEETILIDIDSENIDVGDILDFGESKIEVTQKGKRCFKECVLLKEKNNNCPLKTEPMFGKVLVSGRIQKKT